MPVKRQLRSTIIKRSFVCNVRNTSLWLEKEFWNPLDAIATLRKITLTRLLNQIDRRRKRSNLASAVRLFVLKHVRMKAITARAFALKGRVRT
jgi:predicted DNA-binding ribbon-helix-helix protein